LPAAPIKLSATDHVLSHRFSLLPSHVSLLHCHSLFHYRTTLDGQGDCKQSSPINPPVNNDDVINDSGSESAVSVTFSSLTRGAALMTDGKIPEMSDFYKKVMVTDSEHQGYHDLSWLTSNLLSSIPKVANPTIDGSIVVCFESHLIAVLGLPPSKFLVSIMNFLGCSLIHFNPNALVMLSSFTMLCECWLGIPSYFSIFWYYYSLVRYD
jgi:hypothetical protein